MEHELCTRDDQPMRCQESHSWDSKWPAIVYPIDKVFERSQVPNFLIKRCLDVWMVYFRSISLSFALTHKTVSSFQEHLDVLRERRACRTWRLGPGWFFWDRKDMEIWAGGFPMVSIILLGQDHEGFDIHGIHRLYRHFTMVKSPTLQFFFVWNSP